MLQHELDAGPLSVDVRELETRSIRVAGVELVRRVYFAVRDPAWRTVQPEVLTRSLAVGDGGFLLEAHCRYWADPIELDADIRISATAEGLLRYESAVVAGGAFSYNRIGFCVLHPPAELADAVLTLDGAEEIALSGRILPQLRSGGTFVPAAGPFSRLTIDGASGARLEFRFEGDRFELEDQRNWTDGSFKTYGTPLADGPPPPLAAGAELEQRVELRVVDPPKRPRPTAAAIAELSLADTVTVPRIGFALGSPIADRFESNIRPAHLRVDLRDGPDAFERAFELASALGCGVQLGLHLPLTEAERNKLRALPRNAVTSVLVLNRDAEELTGATDAEEVRQLVAAPARFWTGTDAYYAQLNRGLRPGLGTSLTFSIHPQEHATDEQSMLETLEIQRDVVLDLKAKQPGCRVSVGAVTLGPRRRFSAPPGVAVEEPTPDPRQSSRFGAVWSLASVRYLSEAGVEEATYHALAGEGGLIDENGQATPLCRLFADVAEFGDRARIVECASPLCCTGLAFANEGSTTLLLGNLQDQPTEVRLPVAHGDTVTLGPNDYMRLEVPA